MHSYHYLYTYTLIVAKCIKIFINTPGRSKSYHATLVLYWIIVYSVNTIIHMYWKINRNQVRNKACVGLWFSTNPQWIHNLFLWIHQNLSPSSLPWFINSHGISATRNMTSRLAIKFPTPNEWWSNALPPGQETASNARSMPGGGDVMLKLRFDWYISS